MSAELASALDRFFSLPNWENRCGPWRDIHEGLRAVQKVQNEYRKSVGWRPASEPPTEMTWCLVLGDEAIACRGWNNDKRRWEDWEGCSMPGLDMAEITHWMPLPDYPVGYQTKEEQS